MAITIIEVNTATMARDIEALENRLRETEKHMKSMFTSIKELDSMWDGPSNAEFNRQFQLDYLLCEEMCSILRELINSLRHAKSQYEICERAVESTIQAMRI